MHVLSHSVYEPDKYVYGMTRYRQFCADRLTNKIDCFTPCTCMQGNHYLLYSHRSATELAGLQFKLRLPWLMLKQWQHKLKLYRAHTLRAAALNQRCQRAPCRAS